MLKNLILILSCSLLVACGGSNNSAEFSNAPDTAALPANSTPTVSDLSISGQPSLGETLSVQYTYNDSDGDPEGASTFQWYRNGTAILGAIAQTYDVTAADQGNELTVRVNPVAASGSNTDVLTTFESSAILVSNNTSPTAVAGTDQTVFAGTQVVLNGSGNDSDGSVNSFSWSMIDSSPNITAPTLSDSNNTTTSFTAPNVTQTTTLTFTLTVTDDDGATGTDTVVITVNPRLNVAPTAEAGSAQTVTAGAAVTLSGSGSDTDGSINGYNWVMTASNPTTAAPALSNSNNATTSFTAPNVTQTTTLTFTLTVTDDDGATDTDTVVITVNPRPNVAPTAEAGSAQTVTAGAAVTLSGSGSDTDGSINGYNWVMTASNPTTTAPALSNSNNATTSFTAPNVTQTTTLTFTLTVTDDDGATDTDTVVITVNPRPNVAPTAEAGSSQTVTAGAAVTLSGSGSDTDGSISGYNWVMTASNPTTTAPALSNSNNATTSFTAPNVTQTTTLTFTLTVTDDDGATDTDTVVITVEPANVDPVAEAGPAQTVTSGTSPVTLTGTASDDTDGTIASYSWAMTASSPTVTAPTLTNGTTATATFTAPTVTQTTTLTFTLTVTDDEGATDTDTVVITVEPANVDPVAEAGPAQTITSGTSPVTLTGTASDDTDGTIASYSWAMTASSPTVTAPTLTNGTTATATFTAPTVTQTTTLTFTLTVTDDEGATDTDTVVITVEPANVDPVAEAGPAQTITSGTSPVTLTGTASDDTDGTIASYSWAMTASSPTVAAPTLTNGTTATATFTAPTVTQTTTLTFTLTVTDDEGATDTDTVVITVEPANVDPVAEAGPAQTVTSGTSPVTLTGTASDDTDGTIASYSWAMTASSPTVTAPTLTNGTTATATFTAPTVTQTTTLTFTLTVTDDDGATDTDTVVITVEPANVDPVAEAGPAQTVTSGTSPVTLTGTASDDTDGTIASYSWAMTASSPTVTAPTLTNGTTATATFTAPTVTQTTTLTFTLTVTDDDGATDTDTVVITVEPANVDPVAEAGPAQTVTSGTSPVTLTGTASNDTDGTIASYSWAMTASSPTVAAPTLTNGTTATATFTAPTVTQTTTLTFTLTVTDDEGATDTDTVVITVEPANVDPVAEAGPAQTVTSGTSPVTLTGTASNDTDGTIASYSWAMTASSPTVAAPTLTNGTTATATFTAPTVTQTTTLTFTLTVTDDEGATDTDTVVITVEPANVDPVAEAGPAQTVTSGTSPVTLTGTASNDTDGTIASYSWAMTASSPTVAAPTLTNGTTATATFTAPTVTQTTTLTFTLTVTDDEGATDTDTVIITIEPISGSLIINEISSSYYTNAERWFEIYNPLSMTINLADYKLKSRSHNESFSLNSFEFTLPAKDIPMGGYLVVRSKVSTTSSTDSDQIIYLSDQATSNAPWWTSFGFLELTHNGETVDFVKFGSTSTVPTTTSAWSGSSTTAPTSSPQYGYSIARDINSTDTNTAADWIPKDFPTYAAANDVACNTDNDADGIPDCSEAMGSTYAGIDLYALGARTNQKDIFIEVDYVDSSNNGALPVDEGTVPQKLALEKVAAAFAAEGYVVHFDVGDLFDNDPANINPAEMDLGGGNQLPYSLQVTIDTVRNIYKGDNIDARRRQIFYYMVFGTSQNVDGSNGSSGIAELNGNDSLMTLGGWNLSTATTDNTNQLINLQAGTVMHEFGHNLGLDHGGNEGKNYKPNYVSVMNYLYQLEGLPTIGNNEGDRYYLKHRATTCSAVYTGLTNSPIGDPANFIIDYSDGSGADLDEVNGVIEGDGLGRTGSNAVDFNCDGDSIDTLTNFNANPFYDTVNDVLKDSDDWSRINIIFARTFSGNSGASLSQETRDKAHVNVLANDIQDVAEEWVIPIPSVSDYD